MKIGVLREEKIPNDKRVPLTPAQCKRLLATYPFVDLVVQSSSFRCFSNQMYISEGIEVVDDLNDCDVLLGIKEVPITLLIPEKTYFFFSHTIKQQAYNRKLLISMIKMNITMVDYEVLKDKKGRRIIGFGRYAGIIGAYNGLRSYGLKSERYSIDPAYKCHNKEQMESQLQKIRLNNEKIVVTGKGRAGRGAIELINKARIKEVSKLDFLNKEFDEPVFLHIDTMDYYQRKDGVASDKNDFYNNPQEYKSIFMHFAKHADIFIAAHYYSDKSPFLFTKEDIKHPDFNLKVVADISCDINGPIASTIRPSQIEEPIYGYNQQTEKEDDYMKENVIAVMAVDNLPCELPKDSSENFGNELLDKIIPFLIEDDEHQIIDNAIICKNGDLTSNFEYLRDFVNGS